MIAKYYVAIRPQTNEHHAVHKENCPFLPDDTERIYLGMFSSGPEAVREGQRHFAMSDSCLFCSREHQPVKKKPEHSLQNLCRPVPPMESISQHQKSRMFFFLN
jgi:hypothetical protein